MTWNWQQKDWPEFAWEPSLLKEKEDRFLHESGLFLGACTHFGEADKMEFTVNLISNEALKSSEIEGEMLNRDSLQSSIRRNFGLASEHRHIPPAEQGLADMMLDLYRNFAKPLSHEELFTWHAQLMSGRNDLRDIGRYRTGNDPMQVISGPHGNPKIHFEAPPSAAMQREMDAFVAWFNDSAPDAANPLPALTRAGIAHLYFVCIHPFEDGNGRIARALAGKALSQALKQATLIALSQVIDNHKKDYYDQLERNNKCNRISPWLQYFAETVLAANAYSQRLINFLLAKARLYDRVHGRMNARQEKVIERMFRAGPDGFEGGLSADNYLQITGTSRATATRDLQQLVRIGVLTRTGMRKGTRYQLNLS